MSGFEEKLSALGSAVEDGESDNVVRLCKELLAAGADPVTILNEGLGRGMEWISDRYSKYQLGLPEMMVAADAFYKGLDIVQPEIDKRKVKRGDKIITGVVKYDVHTIGKDMVKTSLLAAGFDVVDLGCDVSSEQFIDAVKKSDAHIISATALMTTSMMGHKYLMEDLTAAGIRDKVKVMIGGAPVSQEWADQIKADAYGKWCTNAPALAKKLLGDLKKGGVV